MCEKFSTFPTVKIRTIQTTNPPSAAVIGIMQRNAEYKDVVLPKYSLISLP